MKTKLTLNLLRFCLLPLAFSLSAFAQGTAFTYQGRLNDGASLAQGRYDLRVEVYDDATGGNRRGLLTNSAVTMSNGLFTTTLDFGFGVFNGGPRWLALAVRTNGLDGEFEVLTPRQAVLPTPYAFWAANASQAVTVSGTVPATGLSGPYSNPVSFSNPANGFAGDGGGLNNVNAAQLGGRSAAQFWQTGGNAGANPTNDAFIGTSDNLPLELRVNSQRALRLEPNGTSPNLIGGSAHNVASNGVVGAFIGGGGSQQYPNQVTADYGAVLGGFGNMAAGVNSTAFGNQSQAYGPNSTAFGSGCVASNDYAVAMGAATLAGGASSTAMGAYTVAGGHGSTAMGWNNGARGDYSTAMGYITTASGSVSTAMGSFTTASGVASTAMGSFTRATNNYATALGRLTLAGGLASIAMGYHARALHDGSFVWADQQEADFDSTAANQFAVRASGGMFIDGWLGIGHPNTPSWPLEVEAAQSVGRFTTTNSVNGAVVVLKNSSESPTYLGAVNFDQNDETPGQIGYFATNALVFRVGGVERMTLDASGLSVNGQAMWRAPAANQPVEFVPNSASAWRLLPNTNSPNIIGGYAGNMVGNGVVGAFIGGGGSQQYLNQVTASYGAVLGGFGNVAAGVNSTAFGNQSRAYGPNSTAFGSGCVASNDYAVAMGAATVADGYASTAMGWNSKASGQSATALGFRTFASGTASSALGSVAAATNNYATAMGSHTIAGGSASTAMGNQTIASGANSTAMGTNTEASGFSSTAMGSATIATNNDSTALGRLTVAGGSASTAMGYRARALHHGSFVWADQQEADFDSTVANQFNLRASGGVRLANDTSLNFGNQTRQMLNLWDTGYGIGVQTDAQYFRSYSEFMWYRGGSHSDAFGDPGAGGTQLMRLGSTGNLIIAGTLSQSSDRNVKEDFAAVDAQEVLAKVAALPIQCWSYTNQPGVKHVGPVAQDFHAAFGLNGGDDKHIATVDAEGVALAAIQGLNQKLEQQKSENAELKARLERLEKLLSQASR